MVHANIFHLFADTLGKAQISFVLIGGFAVNYYQFTRVTGDVDFMMTEGDFDKALPLLEKSGCQLLVRTQLFATLKSIIPPYLPTDILFVDQETMRGILEEAGEADLVGQKLRVPSLKHLFALKLHALKNNLKHRESRDLRDIIELVKHHQIDVKSDSFRDLCRKYGNEMIYEKIIGSIL